MFSGPGPAEYSTLLCLAVPLAGGLALLLVIVDGVRTLKRIDSRGARIEAKLSSEPEPDEQ